MRYIEIMIKSIRHKGLEKFYLKGIAAGIQVKHIKKLRLQLAALDSARNMDDLDIPGYRLHPKREKSGCLVYHGIGKLASYIRVCRWQYSLT